jgi:hypothetical protein
LFADPGVRLGEDVPDDQPRPLGTCLGSPRRPLEATVTVAPRSAPERDSRFMPS